MTDENPVESTEQPNPPVEPPETAGETASTAKPLIKPLLKPSGPKSRRIGVDFDFEEESEIESLLAEITESEEPEEPPAQPAAATPEKGGSKAGVKQGRVIAVRKDDIFVDMGGKSEGVISAAQFDEEIPEPGSLIDVIIERFDPTDGLLVLRRPGSAQEADWSSITVGMIVEGRVTEANQGGLVVDLSGMRGFLPASQVDTFRIEKLETMLQSTVRCYVTEVNRGTKNIVLSRRKLLEEEREAERQRIWSSLAEGQTRTGKIRSIKDFGAFVDLGGVDGLIPISEISWHRINDPSEILKVGQEVQVKIIRIDLEKNRLALSLRQLLPSPWEDLEDRFPIGTNVTGRVTRTADFGAFVEIEQGIEGLVHVSELASHRVRRVTDVVEQEQQITVRVLSIDPTNKRISLSLRAIEEAKEPEPDEPDEPDEQEETSPRPKPKFPLRGGLER